MRLLTGLSGLGCIEGRSKECEERDKSNRKGREMEGKTCGRMNPTPIAKYVKNNA